MYTHSTCSDEYSHSMNAVCIFMLIEAKRSATLAFSEDRMYTKWTCKVEPEVYVRVIFTIVGSVLCAFHTFICL